MYPGGKNNRYQQIINQVPPHEVYIETHLGSGAIMRMKRPARLNIGIDLNLAVLRETAGRLAAGSIVRTGEGIPQLASSELARGSHPGVTTIYDDAAASSNSTMFAGIVKNSDTEATPEMTMAADTIINDDARWQFVCADALAFLQSYPFTGAEFVYSDPPYLFSTRRSQRRLYDFEYDEQDHVKLLTCLTRLPCPVAISGYFSELYADMLAGWHPFTFTSQTRGGGTAVEWLWMNYKPPVALHDYRYLGENFRQRERIKRRKQRWVNRLGKMDELEKRAILWAIREAGL